MKTLLILLLLAPIVLLGIDDGKTTAERSTWDTGGNRAGGNEWGMN